jgi:hypothetical protein
MRSRRYEIPVRFFVEVDEDGEHMELGRKGIPYPYNTKTALPRLLRELAAELERGDPDDGAKTR